MGLTGGVFTRRGGGAAAHARRMLALIFTGDCETHTE